LEEVKGAFNEEQIKTIKKLEESIRKDEQEKIKEKETVKETSKKESSEKLIESRGQDHKRT